MLKHLAIGICLLGAACASEVSDGRLGGRSLQKEVCPTGCSDDVSRALAANELWEQVGDGSSYVNVPPDELAFDDACTQLPTRGPCASACDAQALQQYAPVSGCFHVRCDLKDGRIIVAGACSSTFTTNLQPY